MTTGSACRPARVCGPAQACRPARVCVPARVCRRPWSAATTLALAALALAACGGGAASAARSTPAAQVRPTRIFPAPAGLIAAGQPQPNGIMWLLAGTGGVRTLSDLDLGSGRTLGVVPVSAAASALAESSTGVLGVGLGTATAGALELRNGATGALLATVAVGAPVQAVSAGPDGNTFYVLDGTSASRSVTVVDQAQDRAVGTVGVALDTVSVAPEPTQASLVTLGSGGVVTEVSTAGRQVLAQFQVAHSGRDLALSPDGATAYVLKGRGAARSIAVVNMRTESVTQVLPAPANARRIVVAADGASLYAVVGTSSVGNVQLIPVSG